MSLPISLLAINTASASDNTTNDSDTNNSDRVNRLRVGINAMYNEQSFTNYDNKIAIFPSVFYDNSTIYARGNTLGYNFIKDKENELSIFAQYGGVSYDPDNASNPYAGLEERDYAIFAGASYMRVSPFGALRGQLATAVTGDSTKDGNPLFARLTYLAKFKQDKLTLYPSVGLQWQDDNYNDYYYGVTAKETAKTGISNYSPADSIHPYANVMGMYDLTDDWGLFLNQKIAYNPDEIYNSPKVDSRTNYSTTVGVTYSF